MEQKFLLKREEASLSSFTFENGETFNDITVEYACSGTPKYDEKGNIKNAIIFCHDFRMDYESVNEFVKLIEKDKPFNRENHFIISITSLGFPNSFSPSTSNLRFNFPKYSIKDMVSFKRQFLKEQFKIEKVYGILGHRFGGFEALYWAAKFPCEIDFVVVISTTYKIQGYKYLFSKIIDNLIESDVNYTLNSYNESLSKTLVTVNELLYANTFSNEIFQNLSKTEIDILMEDFVEEGLFLDIYDIKYRNEALLNYDISDIIENIKSNVLIVYSDDTDYFNKEFDAFPMKEMIKNSELCFLESGGNINILENIESIEEDIFRLLEKVKNS